jgi:hypothetical protein
MFLMIVNIVYNLIQRLDRLNQILAKEHQITSCEEISYIKNTLILIIIYKQQLNKFFLLFMNIKNNMYELE